MDTVVESALKNARDHGQFEIEVRIEEDPKKYATLDLDLSALEQVMFVAKVAEFLLDYSQWKLRRPAQIYSSLAFERFDLDFLRPYSVVEQNPADLIAEGLGDSYRRRFENLFSDMKPAAGFVAREDVLRLELVALSKLNPTLLRLLAKGTTNSVVLLSVLLGGVYVWDATKIEECRVQLIELAREGNSALDRQAKLEGKLSPPILKAREANQKALNIGMASCQSGLKDIVVAIADDGARYVLQHKLR